jgi:hypothetical protein
LKAPGRVNSNGISPAFSRAAVRRRLGYPLTSKVQGGV